MTEILKSDFVKVKEFAQGLSDKDLQIRFIHLKVFYDFIQDRQGI